VASGDTEEVADDRRGAWGAHVAGGGRGAGGWGWNWKMGGSEKTIRKKIMSDKR
jgi:hypothetical protein